MVDGLEILFAPGPTFGFPAFRERRESGYFRLEPVG
jgi:hypothetical protein